MIEDITIELLGALEIDKYVSWLLNHQVVVNFPDDEKNNFHHWRTMSFNSEKDRFLNGIEFSALPIEIICFQENKLIADRLNNYPGRLEIVSCIVNGLFYQNDLYELANVCGVIDFIQFVKKSEVGLQQIIVSKNKGNPSAIEEMIDEKGMAVLKKIEEENITISDAKDLGLLYLALLKGNLIKKKPTNQEITLNLFKSYFKKLKPSITRQSLNRWTIREYDNSIPNHKLFKVFSKFIDDIKRT